MPSTLLRVFISLAVIESAAGLLTMLTSPLVLGFNGALQRRVEFPSTLKVGSVNRATVSSTGVGGKGQGAWLCTQQLRDCGVFGPDGPHRRPRLVQFVGSGDEGDALKAALRSKCPGTDEALWVTTHGKTRICTTLVSADSGEATEIVEPSAPVLPAEVAALLAAVATAAAVNDGQAAGVLVMGSLPPGVPPDAYGRVIRCAAGPRSCVVVDSVAGLPDTAAAAKAAGCPILLKVNGRELLTLAGVPIPLGSDNADACAFGDVSAAAASLAAALGGPRAVGCVCWTDGPFPGGALDVSSGRAWRLVVPPLPGSVRSPVGAGDAVAGGTFHAWLALAASAAAVPSAGPPEATAPSSEARAAGAAGAPAAVAAFAFGLACGAASCLTAENSAFDLATALALHAQISVEEVK